jgi:hypothetical protein
MKSLSPAETADLAKLHSGYPWVEVVDIECPMSFDQADVPNAAFSFDGARNHILLCSSQEGLFMPREGWTAWALDGGMYANAVPFRRDDIRDTTDSYGRVQTVLTLGDSRGLMAGFLDANGGCCGWRAWLHLVMVSDLELRTVTKSGVTLSYQIGEAPDVSVPFAVSSAATDGQGVTLSLSSGTELDRKYPPRVMLKNYCQLKYMSEECGCSGLVIWRDYAGQAGGGDHELDFATPSGLVKAGDRLSVLDPATGDVLLEVGWRVLWAQETPSAGADGTALAWFVCQQADGSANLCPGMIALDGGAPVATRWTGSSFRVTSLFADTQYASLGLADQMRKCFAATDSALYFIDFWQSSGNAVGFRSNTLKCVEMTSATSGQMADMSGFSGLNFLQISFEQRWAGVGLVSASQEGRGRMSDGIPALFTYNGTNWMFVFGAERYALAVACGRSPDETDGDVNFPRTVRCLLLNQVTGDGRGCYWEDAPWEPGEQEILEPISLPDAGGLVDFSNAHLAEGVGVDYGDGFVDTGGRHFLYPNPDGGEVLLVEGGWFVDYARPFATEACRPAGSWHAAWGSDYRYAWNEETGELVQLGDSFSGAVSLGLLPGLGGLAVKAWNSPEGRPSEILAVVDGHPVLAKMASDEPCDHSLAACRQRANRQRFGGFAGIGSGGLLE